MGPVGYLLALSVVAAMAAAAPQAGGTQFPFICNRDECSCENENGFELVTCDCSRGGSAEPLMLGERSNAFLSDRTLSLRVRNCNEVHLVPEALSNTIYLTELELSDIAKLELQANSLYTDDGSVTSSRQRRITIQNVGDLQVDPLALNKVKKLQQLELTDLVAGHLPLDSFAPGADVVSVRLADSSVDNVSFNFSKADQVTVTSCKLDALSVDVGDVLSVTITDNTMKRVDALRINVRDNAHSTDTNNVTIARNAISAIDSDDVQMTLDRFELVDNAIGSLLAPLRVEFSTADVTGNEIGRLGPTVFDEFVRLPALNIRGPSAVAELAFTFGNNTLRASASTNGSYGLFLTPVDERSHQDALYRVYGNRFTCRCEDLEELVRVGEDTNTEEDGDGLFPLEEVYGALYRTSRCVEGDQTLEQYRNTAFTAEFECKEEAMTPTEETKSDGKTNAAASTAAGVLTLLLATAAAASLSV